MPIESSAGWVRLYASHQTGPERRKWTKKTTGLTLKPTKCATLWLAEPPLKVGDCHEGFSCHSLLQRTKHDQGTRSRRPRVSDPGLGDRAGGRLLYGRDPQSDRGRVG